MVKSVHRLFVASDEAEYSALEKFFAALGLGRGEEWTGRRSRGVKFDAPEAGFELFYGEGAPRADLVLEVDNADVVYETAKRLGCAIVDEIASTDWGARIFAIETPAKGADGKPVLLSVFSYEEDWRNEQLAGDLNAEGRRFAVVVARFNAFITERLLAGALDALRRSGAKNEDIVVVRVPGAYEIPQAARELALTGKYDGIVALGCLLRGETAHYDVIVNEVGRGVGQAMQETGAPMGFGVLTCDTLEQAIDRAGLKAGNKGFEAAQATIEMVSLKHKIGAQK